MPLEQQEHVYDDDSWGISGDREEFNQVPEYPVPPEGPYTFELVAKDPDQPQDKKFDPTGTKKRTRFHFEIRGDEDWEDHRVSQYYNISLNEQSYFLPVVEALLGRSLGAKEKVGWKDNPSTNTVGIANRFMVAMLKHDVKTDEKGNVRTYARIEAPTKVRKAKETKAVAAPVVEALTENVDEVPF